MTGHLRWRFVLPTWYAIFLVLWLIPPLALLIAWVTGLTGAWALIWFLLCFDCVPLHHHPIVLGWVIALLAVSLIGWRYRKRG